MTNASTKPSLLQRLYVGYRYYCRNHPVMSKAEAVLISMGVYHAMTGSSLMFAFGLTAIIVINANTYAFSWYPKYQESKTGK